DEQVQITGINGNVVSLNVPLKYWHTGGATYVADVTRNTTFESETVSIVARRGHVMFMHNDDVHVAAAGFYGLGRTDKPRPLDDSAVVDSPGWGIVNHSSNVDVTNNVVFNAVGAAYVTEAGDEIGSFQYNIAIHSLGSGEQIESRKQIQDFGHDGSGFWLQG